MVKAASTLLLFLCLFLVQVCAKLMGKYDIPVSEVLEPLIIIPSFFIAVVLIWLNTYFLQKSNNLKED